MTHRAWLSVLALTVSLVSARAEAQYVMPGPPIYGSFSINLGDLAPGILQGVAGGPVSLSAVDGSCRGTAMAAPSHVILASGPTSVRIAVSSGHDSTLMVLLPDGRRLCNDDSIGLDAMVEASSGAGPIYVWVGSYSSGSTFPYQLTVTQAAPPPPPPGPGGAIGPGGIPLDCGMTRAVYGSLRIGDGLILGAHSPWTGPDGQGGYVQADANWADEMSRWVGQPTVITSFEGLDAAGCAVVRVAADGGQYFWRIRDARPSYGAPPPTPPPMVMAPPPPPAPPAVAAVRVTMTPRTPVTLFAPGITTPTIAVWSPRAGTEIELSTVQRGPVLAVSASLGGVATQLFEIPAALASTAVVTATRRPDGKVLFRAERAPSGVDPGQQMLLLVQMTGAAPSVAQQWLGSFSDHAPAWSR
jgi:hypothetical protein